MPSRKKLPEGVFVAKTGLGIRWDDVPHANGSRNARSKVLVGEWDPAEASAERDQRRRAALAQTKRGAHLRTVSDVLAAWRDERWDEFEYQTQMSYETILARIRRSVVTLDPDGEPVKTTLGEVRLVDLRRSVVNEARRWWRLSARCDGNGGLGAKTVRSTQSLFSEILGWAVREREWLDSNPASEPDLPKWQPISGRFLTVRQIDRLLANMDDPMLRACTETTYFTGIRPGEAVALRVPDVKLQAKLIMVTQVWNGNGSAKLPKGNRQRAVPIGDTLALRLDDHIEWLAARAEAYGEGYRWDLALLFANPDGTPLSGRQFRAAVHEAAYRARLGVVNPKDARSTWTTLADDEAVDEDEADGISDSLGQRDRSIKDRFYVQPQPLRVGSVIVRKPRQRERKVAVRVDRRLRPIAALQRSLEPADAPEAVR